MRASEIGKLSVSDPVLIKGQWYFHLTKRDGDSGRQLKNKSSHRRIPPT